MLTSLFDFYTVCVIMDYNLASYDDFEEEQLMLANESRKKEELEKQAAVEEKEIEFRFQYIGGYFRRLSWQHKKHFVLSIVRNMNCFDTLLRIINYISILYGKMAAYVDVRPYCKTVSQQIILDHDRTLERNELKDTVCKDLIWIASLPYAKQMPLLTSLLQICGGGLLRKLYLPIVTIYNNKVAECGRLKESSFLIKTDLTSVFDEPQPDDSDKYPPDHPASIEAEKMNKKWDETIERLRTEVFGVDNKGEKSDAKNVKQKKAKATDKKPGKAEKKANKNTKKDKQGNKSGSSQNWFQMLPIWIVKNILSYLDQKTLQNLKKVDSYWSYACDSIIKDRHARQFLNSAIEKMKANVDPDILQACRENEGFLEKKPKRPDSPREKRLKKLMNRGTILETMRPKVKKLHQTTTCLVTSIPRDEDIFDPIDKITVFPRLIKEDLLLYNKYPCTLKDVNILIDVEDSVKKQRDTLSYSMSQQMSDTFSLSEANLAEW